MAIPDNLHSRVVFWLKVLLPILALAILSTLFLFSRRIDTDGALPYSEVDVQELARDQRLTDPQYSTMTDDGSALSVAAAVARPGAGDADGGAADDLVMRYDTKDGLRIDLEATSGQIDQTGGQAILRDGVTITTSTGYKLTTSGIDAALDRTKVVSESAVTATGPLGRIDAGRMELRHGDAGIDGYVLIFNDGVKLVYQPVK